MARPFGVNGADVLAAWIDGPRAYVFDPGLRGHDYKADEHGFRPVTLAGGPGGRGYDGS